MVDEKSSKRSIVCSTKIAVIDQGKRHSYNDLYESVERYRRILHEKKIKAGEVVAICSDYSFDAIALFFALAENGNIVVPLISENGVELKKRLEIASAQWVFRKEGKGFEIQKYVAKQKKSELLDILRDKRHAGLIIFSSGSTGEPKAMLHDLDQLIKSYQGRKKKNLNILVFLTFDHIGGIDTMLRTFVIEGTLTIPQERSPMAVCEAVEQSKVNVLPVSPTFINLLLLSGLHQRYDLGSLQIIAFGAEPMPKPLLERIQENFPGVELQQKFGTSETNAVKISNDGKNPLFFKIDDPNVEYRIVNDELWLRSSTQVLGYLNASSESFTEDGWFKTGDLVEKTVDGFIRVVGRNKEIVNVGGEKVFPVEVENILQEMQEVSEVMVYGEEDGILGQRVVVDIVPHGEYEKRELKKKVRRFCRARLESYKIPSKINIVEAIEHNGRFKKIRRRYYGKD